MSTIVTKAQHTRGPWHVQSSVDEFGWENYVLDNGEQHSLEERYANASLIAAAPELLAALKALLSVLPENWGDAIREGVVPAFHSVAADVDDAFAAIAQAEGR